MSSIKQETLHGVKWTAVNKFTNSAVSFLIGIVLARLLTPSDYGVVAMIGIFFAISGIFIDSGFGMALIQKKNVTEEDKSTMMFFNIGMATFCYVVLFIAAPWIAEFLNTPILKDIIRVSGLGMVIGSFGTVQYNMLYKAVDFKTPAIIGIVTNFINGIIGVALAYLGYGPWALVIPGLVSGIISCVSVWVISPWRPKLIFSKRSFHEMVSFGGNLTFNALLDKFYNEGTGFIIGKFYTPAQLGYYGKGQGTATLPSTFISETISGVLLPVMSKIQDDEQKLLYAYSRYMQIMALIVFFCSLLLVALAKPLTVFLYSDKWLPAVIFTQIFCFHYMLYFIHRVNWDLLLVKKRTDLCLKKELVNKIFDFGFLIAGICISVEAIAVSFVLASIANLIVNTYVAKKVFPTFGFKQQFADFFPYMVKGAIACIPAYAMTMLPIHPLIIIIVGGLTSVMLYSFYLYWTKDENFFSLINLTPLKKYIRR